MITTPTGLTFGNVLVSTSANQNLTIQNTGNQTLMVNSIVASGNSGFSLPAPPALPVSVAPGSFFQVTVRFTPTTRGSKSGTVTIGSNDPLTPSKFVLLQGAGVAPVIATTPSSALDCGNVALSSFADFDVSISNNGDGGQTLVVNAISFPGSDAFTCASTLPANVAAGSSIIVKVRFAPTSAGPALASMQIDSNDPFTPAKVISVSGMGVGPAIATEPQSIDFGDVEVSSFAEMPVVVRNDAQVPTDLVVTGISFTGADSSSFDFEGSLPPLPWTIPSGEFVRFIARFSPVSPGIKLGRIAIESNDQTTPTKTIDVQGTGTGTVGVSPGSPLVLALLGPTPNPTTGLTRFDFTLPQAGEATLSIFDIHGRHVATVARGPHPAGRNSVRWDASNAVGGRVAGGVYFARLAGAHKSLTVRFVIVP